MEFEVIDRAGTQKLYTQLIGIIRSQIGRDGWAVGTQIPTEEQLCRQYQVSKATVRLAIAELVSMGYLKRIQGKGTFVRRRRPENRIPMLMNLDDSHLFDDSSTIIRLIENKTLKACKEIEDCIHLSEGGHCVFVCRLIIAGADTMLLQKIYIPYSLLPGSVAAGDLNSLSLFFFLENRCGVKIQRLRETTDVVYVNSEEAQHLELTPESSVLRLKQICYANGDMPISFSESLYRTDTYARTVEFERLRI